MIYRRILSATIFGVFIAFLCGQAQADSELLPLTEAFQVAARRVSERAVDIDYVIAPGYRLYRDHFAFSTNNSIVRVVNISYPLSLRKFDRALGHDVSYYTDHVTLRVTLTNANMPVTLITKAQGCAEIGVCYPPLERAYSISRWTGVQRR